MSAAAIGWSETVERLRAALATRSEIREAYLFGSVARGEPQAHSDIDVAVFVDEGALSSDGYGYAAELGALLQAASARSDIDLVVLNQADPVLYHRVLRDGVRLLACDLAKTTSREALALSRYCDYLPVLRRIETLHKSRIASGNFGR